jgi:NTP pyrophosphatase (non-canonical NTP hydrolase)
MGYHKATIKKGIYGQLSKIQEELDEVADAMDQNCKIMALCELSDVYGALEAYLKRNFVNMSMDDLRIMSNITKSAFNDGER